MKATKNSSSQPVRKTLFEPFEWATLDRGDPRRPMAEFASLVLDVSLGVEKVLAIVERDSLGESSSDEFGHPAPEILSANTRGELERLARASLLMLARQAQQNIPGLGENLV